MPTHPTANALFCLRASNGAHQRPSDGQGPNHPSTSSLTVDDLVNCCISATLIYQRHTDGTYVQVVRLPYSDSEREHHLRRSATLRCAGSSVSLQRSTSMGACNGAHPRPPAGRGPRRPSTSSASHHAQTCQSCCSVVHRPSLSRQQERQRRRRRYRGQMLAWDEFIVVYRLRLLHRFE